MTLIGLPKVGDTIRVINASQVHYAYKYGDEFKVREVWGDGVYTDDNKGFFLRTHEFEVVNAADIKKRKIRELNERIDQWRKRLDANAVKRAELRADKTRSERNLLSFENELAELLKEDDESI